MAEDATHNDLMDKLINHDEAIVSMSDDLDQINAKLDPIMNSLRSIAFAFRGLLVLGSGSAAVLGILALTDYVSS